MSRRHNFSGERGLQTTYGFSALRGFRNIGAIAILLYFVGGFVPPAFAQVYSSSITGVVTDPSGAVIPGAAVAATDAATGFTYSTTTNSAGLYTVENLPPSTYSLTLTATGFATANRRGITLEVNQHATVDVRMTLGTVAQTVTVGGAPPLLDAQDSATGQTVDRSLINDLPLIGRSVFDLTYLSPGVNPGAGYALGFGGTSNDFTSDGGRAGTADILIDGVSTAASGNWTTVLIPLYGPSVEAVQEYKIEQNGYSADKGFGGNTVVNVVMRSGTNHFHGDAYEYLRNVDLDANNWFNNRAGLALANLRENDFGFTLGGPIQKNKTFFFVDYEGTRIVNGTSYALGVPSAAERTGNFGELCGYSKGTFNAAGQCSVAAGQIWDPYSAIYNSKTSKPNNQTFIPNDNMATYTSAGSSVLAGTSYQPAATPGNLIDPAAAKMIAYFPLPNVNVGSSAYNPYDNWAAAAGNPSSDNKFDIKIDRQISNLTRLDARFSEDLSQSGATDVWNNPLFAYGGGISTTEAVNAVLRGTHNFSPTLLLTATYGYTLSDTRSPGTIATLFPSFNSVSSLDTSAYVAATTGYNIPPHVVISTNYGTNLGSGTAAIVLQAFEVHNFNVGLDKIWRRHDFQFGGEVRMMRTDFLNAGNPAGNFTFSNLKTSQLSTATTGGDAMASFLTGFSASGSVTIQQTTATQNFEYGAYLQDNWHATSKLTLNLGLRYELSLPRTERFNRESWLNPNVTSPLSGQVSLSSTAAADFTAAGLTAPNLSTLLGGLQFAGNNDRYAVNPWYPGFAPRFGLAYRLPHNLVVRGGYGIFYMVTNYASGAKGSAGFDGWNETPSQVTTYQGNGYTPYAPLSNPFPTGSLPIPPGSSLGLSTELGTSTVGTIRNWNQVPYAQDWNFGIQHQFGGVLVDVEYIGMKGTHLYNGGAASLDYLGRWVESATSAQITALNTFVPNPFQGVITYPGCSICGSTVAAYQLALPYPQFAGFSGTSDPLANSIYNGFQLRVEKRLAHGLEVLANYTWSKSIDGASLGNGVVTGEGGTEPSAQDPNDLKLERSLSEYDVPQVPSFSYNYQLPFGHGDHWGSHWGSVPQAILGGWQTQGFWRFDDGFPILLTVSSSNSLPSYGPQRPNLTGTLVKNTGSETSMVSQYFADPQVAVTPAAFTLGDAPRALGTVRQQGTQNADLSLFKNFPIRKFLGESGDFQLRLETFNALNHVQFGAPNVAVGASTFGLITSQLNSPRQVQIAAKLYW